MTPKERLRRAVQTALANLDWRREVALGVATAVLTWVLLPEDEQLSELAAIAIAVAAAVVVVPILELGWNFLIAPHRQAAEQNAELRKKIAAYENIEVHPSFPSWTELEGRFRELEQVLQFARIDAVFGDNESWRLAAYLDSTARSRFEAISQIAGAKMATELPNLLAQFQELETEGNAVVRWYKSLHHIGHYLEFNGTYGFPVDEDGNRAGSTIYTGSIRQPANVSATLCLQLSAYQIAG